jgi:hypothetical protein
LRHRWRRLQRLVQNLMDRGQRLRVLTHGTPPEVGQSGQGFVDLGQPGRRLLIGRCVLTHSVAAASAGSAASAGGSAVFLAAARLAGAAFFAAVVFLAAARLRAVAFFVAGSA